MSGNRIREVHDKPPPFLGTWSKVYTAVIVYLAALITAFALFSRMFSR